MNTHNMAAGHHLCEECFLAFRYPFILPVILLFLLLILRAGGALVPEDEAWIGLGAEKALGGAEAVGALVGAVAGAGGALGGAVASDRGALGAGGALGGAVAGAVLGFAAGGVAVLWEEEVCPVA
jgi:hypothetical protein